jgi:hypothetical protein
MDAQSTIDPPRRIVIFGGKKLRTTSDATWKQIAYLLKLAGQLSVYGNMKISIWRQVEL